MKNYKLIDLTKGGRHCCKCNEFKLWLEFNKASKESSGRQSSCKVCVKKHRDETQYNKKYYNENRDKVLIKSKKYTLNNKEKVKAQVKEWVNNNKKHKRKYNREYEVKRKAKDPFFKMKRIIRSRLNAAINSNKWKKNNKFNNYIGCSQTEFIKYIESKFHTGMTWENHGKWHMDHIIPISSAKSVEDLYKLNHYTNLQPLWAFDNMSKGDKCLV